MKRNHRQILSLTLTVALISSLFAIPAEAATKKLKVTSPKTVTVNKSIKIKTNMSCKFKTSNKKIATVSSKGVVKGKKAGKVKITVTAKKTKQKKTVTITVKKTKAVVQKTQTTATPKVNTMQPPQANVPQIPVPRQSEIPRQTPSVPKDTQKPSETAKPATPVPTITAKPPIGTKTSKPSLTPAPTSTATSSPTNPSTTRQPVGITAEFEGKLPINRELSDEATAMSMLIDVTIIVKLKYDDNTEEQVSPQKLYVKQKVVEENGIKYVEATVMYEEFTTVLKVELVDVPKDVLYPIYIDCSYVGDKLKKNQIPNLEDIKTQAIMVDRSKTQVSSDQIRIADIQDLYETEGNKEYQVIIVQDYYFHFNGQILHAAETGYFYVPYE